MAYSPDGILTVDSSTCNENVAIEVFERVRELDIVCWRKEADVGERMEESHNSMIVRRAWHHVVWRIVLRSRLHCRGY